MTLAVNPSHALAGHLIFWYGVGRNGSYNVDLVSGDTLGVVGTPTIDTIDGVERLRSTSSYYTYSSAAVRDAPIQQSFTLLIRAWASAAASIPSVFGWDGTDDIVIYPNDLTGDANGSLRVFWRDLGGEIITDPISNNGVGAWKVHAIRHTYDGASSAVDGFVGGVKVANNFTGDSTGAGPFTQITLGSWGGQSGWTSGAGLSEVLIFDTALTDEQIASLSADLTQLLYDPDAPPEPEPSASTTAQHPPLRPFAVFSPFEVM